MPKEILLVLLGIIIGIVIHALFSRKDSGDNPYRRSDVSDKKSLFEDDNNGQQFKQLPEDLLNEVKSLNSQGKKVNAIKVLREGTGWTLKESKDFVEKL